MKLNKYLAVLSVGLAGSVGAAVSSAPVALTSFNSFAAKSSEATVSLAAFQSFVRMASADVTMPRFNSNPPKGLVLILR